MTDSYCGSGESCGDGLEWDLDGLLSISHLLLLLKLFVAGFDGYGKTDLGLLLQYKY
jgi:hypothetical protein